MSLKTSRLRFLLIVGSAGLIVASCSQEPGEERLKSPIIEMALAATEDYLNKDAAQKNADGIDHLVREHWRKAAADFRRAIAIDPDLAVAHFNLALSLNGFGKPDKAAGHFRKAIDLAPDDPRISENKILKSHLE